jgi:predicted dehydrogenase
MSGQATVAIGLVGAGSMGSLHARVIAQHPGAHLAWVADPNRAAGQAVAEQWGGQWRPAADSLSGADAVVVAAATEAHYAIAGAILDAGLPVLVEKPLTPALDQTDALLEAARRGGIPLMCGLLERYNPAVLTALPLVKAPIAVKSVRHSPYAPRIKTGVAWDLAIHDVDLALRVTGSPVASRHAAVGAFSPLSAPGAEDAVEITLGFASGALATVSASRVAQRKVRTLSIYELDRTIEVDLLRRDVVVHQYVAGQASSPDGRGYREQTVTDLPELVTSREPLAAQLDRFLDLVRGEGDADAERDGIRPPHEVIAQALAARPESGPPR